MQLNAVRGFTDTFSAARSPVKTIHPIHWGSNPRQANIGDRFSRSTRARSATKQPRSWVHLAVASLILPGLNEPVVSHQTAQAQHPLHTPILPANAAQLNTLNQHLQQVSIRYFVEQRDPQSGLILDRAYANPADKAHPQARMASIAATGYGLSAWVLGAANGQIPVHDARAWTKQALDTIEKTTLPEQKGWLAHFIDIETGTPYKGSEISSVDTALFYLGALTAGQYFGGDIQQQVQRMFDGVDFPFMLTQNGRLPDSSSFSHGFYLDSDTARPRFIPHRWDHFSEGIILPLLAMGSTTHPVSDEVWTKGWARKPEWTYNQHKTIGPLPLFTHYYPLGYLNLKHKQDRQGFSPWELANQAIQAQMDYCKDNGYPDGLFGLSACDGPSGYRAYQPENPPPIKPADHVIALPAMVAAMPWVPEAVHKGLETAKAKGWMDTRYGLLCAVDPVSGWKSSDALGIDIGSTLLMLDASLNQRIYRLTDQHPVIKRGLQRAGFAP